MKRFIIALLMGLLVIHGITSAMVVDETWIEIDEYIKESWDDLKVPGLSIGLLIEGDVHYLNYGHMDREENQLVDENTLFEIASISKSFTGLGIAKLVEEGRITLSDPVSMYLPGFHGVFEDTKQPITLEHLLYHTSGIPFESITMFKETSDQRELYNVAMAMSGYELARMPGRRFEYATINYDILGAVIEVVTGTDFRTYIEQEILAPIGMMDSSVGVPKNEALMSEGFKISFFKPSYYDAPRFASNEPAGYIISSAKDMMAYIQYQVGMNQGALENIRPMTHVPDESVPSFNNAFYAYGWFYQLNGDNEINHGGNNPNFTTYISFNDSMDSGLIMLSNSNSENVQELARNIAHRLYGGQLVDLEGSAGGTDAIFSIGLMVCTLLSLLFLISSVYVTIRWFRNKQFRQNGRTKLSLRIKKLILFALVIRGIMLLPETLAGLDWYTMEIWTSKIFMPAIVSILVVLGLGMLFFTLFKRYKAKNVYLDEAPELVSLGIISGICNALIIFLVNISLVAGNGFNHGIYFFVLCLLIYISSRRNLEIRLAIMSQGIIKKLRERIFSKILSANLEEFEGIESGQLIATITNDINQIAQIAGLVIIIITSFITIVTAFVYLGTVSFKGTLLVIGVIAVVGAVYAYFNHVAAIYIDLARETQDGFFGKTEAMINGFKDLIMHRGKKTEYEAEMAEINDEFVNNNINGFSNFVNAFMLGESMFIIVLGVITFGFTMVFPELRGQNLTTFVMILLYILGPITGILTNVPRMMQIRIAINRVRRLMLQLPEIEAPAFHNALQTSETVKYFKAKGVTYQYDSLGFETGFKVGPIDLHVEQGEILFIIGGNGSGKSTLLKAISGLYELTDGHVEVDDNILVGDEVSEHISAVFSDSFMFDKLYNTDLSGKEKMVNDYLRILELDEKVELMDGMFSTISLSTGQRKRLHLLRCLLEDKPILMFDEIAADQDPHFRQFFYRELLPQIRDLGKIIIAVTHDDHYFDIADKVIKLDFGQIDDISSEYTA